MPPTALANMKRALDVQQRLDREQAVVAHVDMRADREQPLGHRPVAVLQRALDQRILRQLRLQLAPQRDALEQRAALVHARQAVAQRRVHVEMRIDERRAQQQATGFDHPDAFGRRQVAAQGFDAAGFDQHVDAGAAVGQGGIADQHVVSARRGSEATAGDRRCVVDSAHPERKHT
jgi:hypothetical protein